MACRSLIRNLVIPILIGLSARHSFATTITYDFSDPNIVGAPGDKGPLPFVGAGVTVSGLWKDDATWTTANLYVRNQPDDHGFGVCSPADRGTSGQCPGPIGGGDFNELDNDDAPELIRLALDPGFEWVSVQVSSLDDNDDGEPDFEFGRLWADADGDPDTFDVNMVFWEFMGHSTNVEPFFDEFPNFALTAPFLFFEPFDWRPNGTNVNNDFLVYRVTVEQTDALEPGTFGLLGIGLLALGRLRRKR